MSQRIKVLIIDKGLNPRINAIRPCSMSLHGRQVLISTLDPADRIYEAVEDLLGDGTVLQRMYYSITETSGVCRVWLWDGWSDC